MYLEIFQKIFYLAYEERGRENTSTVVQRATTWTHTMLQFYLSDENNILKGHVKKAIAIKQKNISVSSDELGLDLPVISNPI